MKVVINKCYGGFSLSPKATLRLYELGCSVIATPVEEFFRRDLFLVLEYQLQKWHEYLKTGESSLLLNIFSPDEKMVLYADTVRRNDPLLVQVVEELGEEASGRFGALKIVEIPDDVEFEVQEYDGMEWIAEKHRTWG